MTKKLFLICSLSGALLAANHAAAVELLISGNFETPGGVGKVPNWKLQEFITGSSAAVTSAQVTTGTDPELWLRAFAGGGPQGPAQGNFDNDGLPAGDIDGNDFLLWQRGGSPTPGAPADLATWRTNYGLSGGRQSNAILSQVVPAAPGVEYSFTGDARFEDYYSGYVNTLGDAGPLGQIASPTVTQFKMEFLDANLNLLGSTLIRDLRPEVGEPNFPNFAVTASPLVGTSPAGTANIRVTAEALNMVYNDVSTNPNPGTLQSAFFNNFLLNKTSDPATNLLSNGDLNLGVPDALDFWNQQETPGANGEPLRTASFANHTPGGSLGVWLSAFWGGHLTSFLEEPVDGIMSQTVGAVAGGTYTFSGWSRFEANYSGGVDTIANLPNNVFANQASPTVTEIRLDFLDVDNNVIGSSAIDVKAARRLLSPTTNANDNQWYQHTLQAVAPAGTVKARLLAQMLDGVFNTDPGQSAFFDDFSLDGPAPPSGLATLGAVPEPSSLAIFGLGALLLGVKRIRQ